MRPICFGGAAKNGAWVFLRGGASPPIRARRRRRRGNIARRGRRVRPNARGAQQPSRPLPPRRSTWVWQCCALHRGVDQHAFKQSISSASARKNEGASLLWTGRLEGGDASCRRPKPCRRRHERGGGSEDQAESEKDWVGVCCCQRRHGRPLRAAAATASNNKSKTQCLKRLLREAGDEKQAGRQQCRKQQATAPERVP